MWGMTTARKEGLWHPNLCAVKGACLAVAGCESEGVSVYAHVLVLRHAGYLFARAMLPRWKWRRYLFLMVRADKVIRQLPGAA